MPNKISDADAKELRILRAIGTPIKELAAEYQISLSATRACTHGDTHKNAGGPIEPPAHVEGNNPKMSPDMARELRVMRATMGLSFKALADEYGVGESAVQSAVHGKTYPDAGGPIEPPGTVENWTARQPAAHGRGMYQLGCRCEVCVTENKRRCREWRKKVGYGPRAKRGVHRHT